MSLDVLTISALIAVAIVTVFLIASVRRSD